MRAIVCTEMMYSTPIQTAAFRSALMPGFAVAAAVVRFVFTLFSPIVAAGPTGSPMRFRSSRSGDDPWGGSGRQDHDRGLP
jgi:hypothetical protein